MSDTTISKNNSNTLESKLQQIFIEPDEHFIASLGDDFLKSFLTTKRVDDVAAILTDKRLYLSGDALDDDNGLQRVTVRKTVDLNDVTGTGFMYTSPQIMKLILGILALFLIPIISGSIWGFGGMFLGSIVGLLIAVPLIYSYVTGRYTYFIVEYPGGNVNFDASICGLAEVQAFEKKIRRAKIELKG